jgi:type I restriction enzyme S subunit
LPYTFFERTADGTVRDITEELPFEIPESWEWVRLRNIGLFVRGSGIKRDETRSAGIPCVRYGEVYTTYNIAMTNAVSFVDEGLADRSKPVNRGDLLLTLTGENKEEIGKTIAFMGDERTVIGGDLALFTSHQQNPMYLSYLMNSPLAIQQKKVLGTGDIIVHISCDKLASVLAPIPPLEEQARIVARIEELLPHVADYNAAEQQLSALNATFPEALKKSILQAAVQGKLVPQDPSDEPASVLLDRIRAEKDALATSGKAKRGKYESVIFRRDNSHYEKRDGKEVCIDDEIPFDIPESWEWVRFENICNIARGGSPRPIKDYLTAGSSGINWIKISDTAKDGKYIYETHEKIIPEGAKKSRFVYNGDFLLTNSMSFGRPYILKTDGCIHDGWLVISDYRTALDINFFYYALSSRFAYYQFCEQVSGAVVKNLNIEKVNTSFFPLPPKREQKKIVEYVDKLFALLPSM